MGGRLVRFYIHGVMGCFHLDESEDSDSILRPTVQFLNPRKNIAIALTDCHVDQVVQRFNREVYPLIARFNA